MSDKLPCFACGIDLGLVSPGKTQPYGGLTFIASGNYGSRIFDPTYRSSSTLHIVICDQCVVAAITRVTSVGRVEQRPQFTYERLETEEDIPYL